MNLRSILFVPADKPERFAKAAASGADAIILDLEDAVSPEKKPEARKSVAEWLARNKEGCTTFVRVNPEDSGLTFSDLEAVLPDSPNGLIWPKAEGAGSVNWLLDAIRQANPGGKEPLILPIATETPGAIFELGSYREVSDKLLGVSWGAEDLPAAIGAVSSRELDGRYTPPYEMARSLTLFAAHAAGVEAIDTVFPAIRDEEGLKAYASRSACDGFTGMLAIHPAQVETINNAFTPTAEQIADAQMVVDAFAINPGAGALQVRGKMVDAPHLKAAIKTLERAKNEENLS